MASALISEIAEGSRNHRNCEEKSVSDGISFFQPVARARRESPKTESTTKAALNTEGLGLSDATLAALLDVDVAAWRDELPAIEAHYAMFGDRLPAALRDELEELRRRLG